jgi:uncharacterized membrane protein
MGGADFSSGSSGGGSDSGSSSYDSGSSSYAGGYSSSSRGDGGGGGGFFVALGVVVFFLIFVLAGKLQSGTSSHVAAPVMFLSSLALGIDWHARRELQRKLSALAAQKLGGTPEGRARMLREVVLALERAELSWLYVACEEPRSLAPSAAESAFRAACQRRARGFAAS